MSTTATATRQQQTRQRLHHYRVVRETVTEYSPVDCGECKRSSDIYSAFRDYCNSLDREQFIVIACDVKARITGWHVVSQGTLNTAPVHPREVFRFALLSEANSIVFLHNHPSGDPTPSEGDILMTARLLEAGKLLGIHVVDHIICGDVTYYSFADHGRMR